MKNVKSFLSASCCQNCQTQQFQGVQDGNPGLGFHVSDSGGEFVRHPLSLSFHLQKFIDVERVPTFP